MAAPAWVTHLVTALGQNVGKVNSSIPATFFHGKTSEDGDRFIDQFNAQADSCHWTEEQARQHMTMRLQDSAFVWFKASVNDQLVPPPRAVWSAMFREKYGRNNECQRAEVQLQLQDLKQGAMSVEEFSRRFEDLALRYDPTMSDREKIDWYTQKLRPSLMGKVLEAQPATYEAARKTAAINEAIEARIRGLMTGPSIIAASSDALIAAVTSMSDRLHQIDRQFPQNHGESRRVTTGGNSQPLGQGRATAACRRNAGAHCPADGAFGPHGVSIN